MIPSVDYTLLGYALGSIPFGLLLTRGAGLGDIRAIGSGSIGATNVLRTGRRLLAATTVLLDGGKGAAGVLIAQWQGGHAAGLWAGLGAVIGHLFPIWLGFRGGKGVATGLGVLLTTTWPVGVLACVIWFGCAAVLRISSAAALLAFALAPALASLISGWEVAAMAMAITVLVFVRHEANIRRLLDGTEPRIGRRRR